MSKHKFTDIVCVIIVIASIIVALLFMNGKSLGLNAVKTELPYVQSLFSNDKVHTIDIAVDKADWQNMLDNALKEEYINCDMVIDGNAINNVAIRPKGNSSLSQMATSDSDRYSFKVEFDHYDIGNTYFGLDKLALNNIIQDNTYMKDFLSYDMMNKLGAYAPLSSFAYITVNGEKFGLYLAVEGVEDSFMDRVYGSDDVNLYKPDNMDVGKDRSNDENIQDRFRGDMFQNRGEQTIPEDVREMLKNRDEQNMPQGENFGDEQNMPFQGMVANGEAMRKIPMGGMNTEDMAAVPGGEGPDMGDTQPNSDENVAIDTPPDNAEDSKNGFNIRDKGMPGRGGSSTTALIYTDVEYESYSNIFDNAKTDITDADKDRLIEAIKKLNDSESVADAVDIDEVIKYFAVHNFVLNGDSYTGNLIHNYYLAEDDGKMSMIAWDYNLAFGAFSMGSSSDATSLVNYPLDDPLLSGSMKDRPMISWIFENEQYLDRYHQAMSEFLSEYFENGYFEKLIDDTFSIISPYVQDDPTAFCTYDEFETGVKNLKEFFLLRAESLRAQLDGGIPSDSEGQNMNPDGLMDASEISVNAMGSQGAAK